MSQDAPNDRDRGAQPTEVGSGDIDWGLQLEPGSVLGERYQIRALLGCGGIGEVWRAFDLKLRVEVALKGIRPELLADKRRRESLRTEVRAAREVVSPNVCRIFDLIEIDGHELVSMEYVDGGTLLEMLRDRGPLELKEAQDVASQFLAGLESIHQAGLVHRDVKPENIMITRAGRVVLMDLGLARQETEGAGSVAGTPAYMAPEQATGQTLDARSDVYAAGVVLAEMVSPDGIKSFESRQSLWKGVRAEPARVPDSPWAPVLKKAMAKQPDQRYNSAHTLTRALEEVTLRVEGAEDLHPYPGLDSFTESDAEYFFGREAEVEQMWSKLDRPHLLGLIGPSGVGKSSFIRAGLLAAAPPDWTCLVCTPGDVPVLSLGRALARTMTGDAEIVEQMLSFDDPDVAVDVVSRWRNRAGNGLLVVDQFEELFTLNAEDVQGRFAELLGRLAIEADVHVLVSMRDDFLFRCSDQPALAPVFSELTPLRPPSGAALRRAVIQPAMNCGYRFEDDALVDELLNEVEGERGALPLLAFAMSKLWEKRDRENGLLTRQAYDDVGGVGGALARHAEATIDRIGSDRIHVVREILRNLVASEGTRAARDWNELLSIFSDSHSKSQPEEVLRQLIDARLLTSYEVQAEDEAPTRSVEIIHESLLANWPRLVRWQTQDEEGAQLRDELRHAARSWDEHGRQDDRLWTGTAFREFQLWSERYPGGLTESEEAFGGAMTALAGRRRRRRRMVVAAGFAVLLAGLAIVGSFWQRSIRDTRRAEAQKLTALGRLEIEGSPSATVAHAISSLELADTAEARRLALEALWKGPTALVVNKDDSYYKRFSADGRWLAYSIRGSSSEVRVIRADGTTKVLERVNEARDIRLGVSPKSGTILTWDSERKQGPQHLALWSAPEGQLLAEVRYEDALFNGRISWNNQRVLLLVLEDDKGSIDAVSFDGTRRRLGNLDFDLSADELGNRPIWPTMDYLTGRWLGVVLDNEVWVVEIGEHGLSEPRRLGQQEGSGIDMAFDPLCRYLTTVNQEGEIRIWDPTGALPPRMLEGYVGDLLNFRFTHDGSMFSVFFAEDEQLKLWMWSLAGGEPKLLRRFDLGAAAPAVWEEIDPVRGHLARVDWDQKIRIWPFSAPAGAEPLIVGTIDTGQLWPPVFDRSGRWLATTSSSGLTLYPLGRAYPSVMRHDVKSVLSLLFAPDGRWLASCGSLEAVRIWPLEAEVPPAGRVLFEEDPVCVAVSPDGQHLLVGTQKYEQGDLLLSLDGSSRRMLTGFRGQTSGVAVSPDGRLAAGAGGTFDEDESMIRVWDVASGETLTVLVPEADLFEWTLQFTADNHLLSSGQDGLRRWNIKTGDSELLYEGMVAYFSASADGRRVLLVNVADKWAFSSGPAVALDLETGIATPLNNHGNRVFTVALDKTGTIAATGDLEGVIRVGPVTGEVPHLLLGHENRIFSLAFDPLGRWIASSANDGTARLWPIPDLSKPPLHTLPHDELIAKLKTLTNLRVVRDEESTTGWKLEVGPFPGWETVPSW